MVKSTRRRLDIAMKLASQFTRTLLVMLGSMACCGQLLAQQTKQPVLSKPLVLTLPHLLAGVMESYPTLKAARLEARALSEDVSVVELQKWPTLSATVESNSDSIRSTPSRGLQLDHTLWDAGRISNRTAEAKSAAEIGLIRVQLQQQELFLQVNNYWQSLLNTNERAKVANETLELLNAYRIQMQRRVDVEASPRIDLELADSRMLQTEVELKSAQSNYRIALTRLEQLSGIEGLVAGNAQAPSLPPIGSIKLFAEALERLDVLQEVSKHPSVQKARIEVDQSKQRLDVKKADQLPQLYVRMYQPLGTIPSSNDTSLSTFIGLRYSPGAGFSSFAETKAMATRIASTEQGVSAAQRDIEQLLRSDREEFLSALLRIGDIEKSVMGSRLVLESYQRQFQAQRKTWQDLLNAVRELAQNQYALTDARASLIGSMYRLQIRTGQPPQ